jgi:hypothetical protein
MLYVKGKNIWEFGLFLVSVGGLYDQPERKNILTEQKFRDEDITFNDLKIDVKLCGNYESTLVCGINVKNFTDYLKEFDDIDFVFDDHGERLIGRIINGAKVELRMTSAVITFTIIKTLDFPLGAVYLRSTTRGILS